MKYIFFSFIISLILGASICCAPPPRSPAQEEKELVQGIREKTVALVKEDEEGVMYPYCAGVWVAKDLILTAHHCLKGEKTLIAYKTITDKGVEPRFAFPLKMDELNDLLLLKASEDTLPEHSFANIAKKVWIGERVHIVGHPDGLWWSYFPGTISSNRNVWKEKFGDYQKLLQISAPVWMGNSGGGAFDDNGDLVGISSWIMLDVPSMAFFIRGDAVGEFLKPS